MRKLKGWRTVIYNAATGVATSGLIVLAMTTDWQVLGFSAHTAGWVVLGAKLADSVVNIALRAKTDTALGKAV